MDSDHESLPELAPPDAEDLLLELVGFLRHSPGCPVERGEGDCLCSLDGTIEGLRRDYHVEVERCHGCGVHAIAAEGTEDWAYIGHESGGPLTAYCNGCATALMDANADRPRWWRRVRRILKAL